MEDHLRNRDRLAKEWQALCAYQAEPSVCSIAQSEANLKKNRSPDYVPCEYRSHPAPGAGAQGCIGSVVWSVGTLWGRSRLRCEFASGRLRHLPHPRSVFPQTTMCESS